MSVSPLFIHACVVTFSAIHTHSHTLESWDPHNTLSAQSKVFNQGWWCWSDHRGAPQYGGPTDVGYSHRSVPLRDRDHIQMLDLFNSNECGCQTPHDTSWFHLKKDLDFFITTEKHHQILKTCTNDKLELLLPDRLKLDWCRLRIGGGWLKVGDVLADGEGVIYLAIGATSCTGPSYIPRVTPCFTWKNETKHIY